MAAPRKVDYDRIEPEWRAGQISPRELARRYTLETGVSVSHAAIHRHFKSRGIDRQQAIAPARVLDRSVPVVEVDPMLQPGYVYCMRIDVAGDKLYKVGMGRNPDVRVQAHQTSLPFDAVICIAYYAPSMRQEESALHQAFQDKRVRGEWFRLNDEDLDYMASRARLA